jgi:hypothetical protein
MALLAICLFLASSIVSADIIFPDNSRSRDLNLSWKDGGAKEVMRALIIMDYPITIIAKSWFKRQQQRASQGSVSPTDLEELRSPAI